MTIHLGNIPASSTLYVPFSTYDANGASVTITGLATSDIEIYKNGSVTQRSSDSGYTLLDTDGIDFDSTTGIHGFSVDLSDNTDAGFYAVGSFYWIVVASITVSSQTVNFVAATFRIVAAEAVTGYPLVDVGSISGDTTAPDNLEADYDGTGYNKSNSTIGTCTTNTDLVSAASVADAVWDEDATAHQATGSFGQAIGDPGANTETMYDAVVTDAAGTNIAADVVALQASVDGLNDLSAAEVNAEVVDGLYTDTITLLGQVAPAASPTIAYAVGFLYKIARNQLTTDSTNGVQIYADDASTVDHKATISDNGTTFTRGEFGSGP